MFQTRCKYFKHVANVQNVYNIYLKRVANICTALYSKRVANSRKNDIWQVSATVSKAPGPLVMTYTRDAAR